MPLLSAEPSRAIQSIEELFAVARKLEHEASENYAALADRARREGVPELASLFERLARDERAHEQGIETWAETEIHKRPEPASVSWQLPMTFEMEAASELAGSRLASAYKILSMAVRNEERAFEFWTYVAAQAPTGEIRKIAERMARAELEHVAALRRARRQAYHAERKARPPMGEVSAAERLAQAGQLESRLAELLEALAARLPRDHDAEVRDLAEQARSLSDEAQKGASAPPPAPGESADAVATAERLVDAYLEIGEHARDEATVAKAQSLARRAIVRLGRLRSVVAGQP